MKKSTQFLVFALVMALCGSVTDSFAATVERFEPEKVFVIQNDVELTASSTEFINYHSVDFTIYNTPVLVIGSTVKLIYVPSNEAILATNYESNFHRRFYLVRYSEKLPNTFDHIKKKLWLLNCNIRKC